MSETMTASERAKRLTDDLIWAARTIDRDIDGDEERRSEADRRRAALLAYVARLEACVAAAREAADQYSVHYGFSEPDVMSGLFDALAALDRPEDGEAE